jgi:hypothetical protein
MPDRWPCPARPDPAKPAVMTSTGPTHTQSGTRSPADGHRPSQDAPISRPPTTPSPQTVNPGLV